MYSIVIFPLVMAVFIHGCGPSYIGQAKSVPVEQLAQVEFDPGSGVSLESIDEKKEDFTGPRNSFRYIFHGLYVTPGTHQIELSFSTSEGGVSYRSVGNQTVTFYAKAGEVICISGKLFGIGMGSQWRPLVYSGRCK